MQHWREFFAAIGAVDSEASRKRWLHGAAYLVVGGLVMAGGSLPLGAAEEEDAVADEEVVQEGETLSDEEVLDAEQAHDDLFGEERYPSAATCGTCHPKQYEEWSVSQHSYAQLSPVYMAINNFLNFSTSSSMGDFCLRCHNQVGANLGESPFISNLERHPTSREGITCVVCHRIDKAYNKVSGRLALAEGGLLDPVYGPKGNDELERVLGDNKYRVVTKEDELGRKIHTNAREFAPTWLWQRRQKSPIELLVLKLRKLLMAM